MRPQLGAARDAVHHAQAEQRRDGEFGAQARVGAGEPGGEPVGDLGAEVGAQDVALLSVQRREDDPQQRVGALLGLADQHVPHHVRAEVVQRRRQQGVGVGLEGHDAGEERVLVAAGQVAGGDLAFALQAYAEVAGPGGEDLQQPVAADAVTLVAAVPGRPVTDVGDTLAPPDRVGVEDVGRLRMAPARHAPAVSGTLRIAFMDGDVVGRVLPLEQDREIRTGGPAADTGDLHEHP